MGNKQVNTLTVERMLYHRTVLRLAALGKTVKEISAALDTSVEKVRLVMSSPAFKREFLDLQEQMTSGVLDVQSELSQLAPVALKKKEEILLTTQSPELANKVAGDLLDRAGHGALQRQKVDIDNHISVTHTHMTEQEMRKLILERLDRASLEEQQKMLADERVDAIELKLPDESETGRCEDSVLDVDDCEDGACVEDVIEGTVSE